MEPLTALDTESPRPLYLQLADYLRRQIDIGALKPYDRLPPEIDLAANLAVSRGTVRQALDLLVKQGLLQRIPGKGTFVTEPDLRPGAQLIGIVVPYLRDSLTSDMLRGAENTLRRNNYSLIFCHSEGDLALEYEQIKRLMREGVSGMILFPLAVAEEAMLLTRILSANIPLVLLDRRLPGVKADCVLVDNMGGAYRAVEHLIELGHRHIACIRSPDQPSSVLDRVRGYEQALRDEGILPLAAVPLALHRHRAVDEEMALYTNEELAPIDMLLRASNPPTALFCINDIIAFGVMHYLLARGLRVPDDIAIVGFDDIPLAPYMPVPLTTVAQPKYEIGVRAAELLLARLAGKKSLGRELALPTSLVVRESSIPAAPSPTQRSFPAAAQQ
ncbi:MAG: GntR family transcriptional regulator [Chloroflexales bacterium]|nr:GntR family transcriptional regulator [Chloroflexales bacterium]